jgi:hypothetical protein
MVKAVHGVYKTRIDAMQAIHELEANGFNGQNITILAEKEDTLDFARHLDEVNLKTAKDSPEDDTFIDKVLKVFYDAGNLRLESNLLEAGLSEIDAAAYLSDVEQGKVLILLDQNSSIITSNYRTRPL